MLTLPFGEHVLKQVDQQNITITTGNTVRYYSTIESALGRLAELRLSDSDAQSVAELRADIKRYKEEMIAMITMGVMGV